MVGGMHSRGHAWWGGMHDRGHVWQRGMHGGSVCGGEHAWQGVCMAGGVHGRRACMVMRGMHAGQMATETGGTHPINLTSRKSALNGPGNGPVVKNSNM